MKIAISTDQGFVSSHFGRCAAYTIVEVEGTKIVNTEEIVNPGHYPGFLPEYLSEKGVNTIICGGMGHRAQSLFRAKGIDTIVGVVGSVEEVIRKFASGELEQGESLCEHGHGEAHGNRECRHGKRKDEKEGGFDAQT
ncbi:dinitrogenase iron-molybdenum cofactor [candidate division TA06 bacterium DG_26]|uniref:Dinitrogenase iron-molybdenum cofactor n=1 Tax=candidate division TA06 bacterium DG_26 TaxID=1703771 RepID=A0A0S7WM78_UNCT6|nr:MAG: dinitrogenase iron-molybdenum cofactor [candidate division TA06 bacterium DG_26]